MTSTEVHGRFKPSQTRQDQDERTRAFQNPDHVMFTEPVHSPIALVSCGSSRTDCPRYSRFQSLHAPGLFYIKAALEAAGIPATVIDQPARALTDDQVVEAIYSLRPRFVLFNQFFNTRDRVRRIATSLNGNFVLGVGGHDPSFHLVEIGGPLGHYDHFDFIWQGEADTGLPDFLRGFTRSPNGPIVAGSLSERLRDLDLLPLLGHDDYEGPCGFLVTSRGCLVKGCDFCTTPAFYSDGWRPRSVAHVLPELDNLVANGRKYVMIADDNFLGFTTRDLLRAHQILQGCRERSLKVMFLTMPDRLLRADEMGYLPDWAGTAFRIFLGVENGSDRAARKLGKCRRTANHSQKSQKAILRLREVGIPPLMGYIGFAPDFMFADLRQSAEFLRATGAEASKFINFTQELRIFEGTPWHKRLISSDRTYSVELGEYKYDFDDPRVGALYTFLRTEVQNDTVVDVDNLIFDIEDLIAVNELPDSPQAGLFERLKAESSELNYTFFIQALSDFENGPGKPNPLQFHIRARGLLDQYRSLHDGILTYDKHS